MKRACFYTTINLHDLELSGNKQIQSKNNQDSSNSKRDFLKKVNHLLILSLVFFFYILNPVALNGQTATLPSGSGTSGSPYLIASLNNLYWIADQVENYGQDFTGIYFRQTANIDASSTSGWSGGWLPIAGAVTSFYGNYDGNGHTILNLYINRTSNDCVGLFGYLGVGTIQNLGLVNVTITGHANVGGLVGYMDSGGSLSNCYTSGSVSATYQSVGGLLGANDANSGTINQCYSNCSVTSIALVGGLIGYDNNSSTTISNCYSTGSVSGSSIIGGLIGQVSSSTSPSNCFWDTQTSGQSSSGGGTGKTTTQMKTASTFTGAGWSTSNWSLIDGCYPKLIWQVPAIQASSISFSSITNTTMTISCTAGDGGQRAVFVKEGSGAITNPTDGTTYTASSNWSSKGTQLGSSGYYCVYNGPNESISLTNLSPVTQYYVQIFEYDGTGTNSKYLTTTATNNPNNQTTLPNAPTVSGISPVAGPTAGGTTVTITGTYLTSATSVHFGGNTATITGNTATQITATSPAGSAGIVDITVTTAGGTSAASSSDQFTYVATPTISGISPSNGPTAGGTSVTITGTNLSSATSVNFGSNTATITGNTSTQITVTSPAGSAGTIDITVTTAGGTSATSSVDQFTYVAAPSVSGISPTYGITSGGTSVTITGTNLSSATSVHFGSNTATITGNTATQITATSPAGSAGTIDITVTTAGGTSSTSSSDQFTYLTSGTFTGATSNDWATATNWAGGSVPTSATDVTIPTGKTVVIGPTTTADCNNLSIDASGSLTIQSDASGTGSLIIHGTTTGNATCQRYMTGSAWHLVSPISAGGSISTFIQAAGNAIPINGSNYGMMDYNETTNLWNSYFTASTVDNFTAGKGYCVRRTSDGTVTFTGTLTSGTKAVSLTKVGEGWNCVGNPYTSSVGINADAGTTNNFLQVNAIDHSYIDPSYCVYVWDDATKTYKIVNNAPVNPRDLGVDLFAPGQAFFVKAASAGVSIEFNQNMQVHSTAAAYKSTSVTWPTITLDVSNNITSASAVVAFSNSMTNGLDPTYDAGLLRGSNGLSVYTRLVEDNGVDFAIQCLPEAFDKVVIPVGVDCTAGGEVTFNATINDLPADCSLLLEDKVKGILTPLGNNGSYTVTIDQNSEGIGRFYIHLYYETTLVSPVASLPLKVYPANGNIYIIGNPGRSATAYLSDLTGRNLGHYNLVQGNSNTIPAGQLKPGVYLLRVIDGERRYASKIVIK